MITDYLRLKTGLPVGKSILGHFLLNDMFGTGLSFGIHPLAT